MEFNFIEYRTILKIIGDFSFIIVLETDFDYFIDYCCSRHTRNIIEVINKKVYIA